MRPRTYRMIYLALVLATLTASAAFPDGTAYASQPRVNVERVMLITLEGAHALDIARYVRVRPQSALAQLSRRGITYTNARTPVSDSVPGLIALVAGATPNSSGIPYIPWYDRRLAPPGIVWRVQRALVGVWLPGKPSLATVFLRP